MDMTYFFPTFPLEPGVWLMLWHLTVILVGAKLLFLPAPFFRNRRRLMVHK